MAITNRERVGKAMDLLSEGLKPFVERELLAERGKYWVTAVTANWQNELKLCLFAEIKIDCLSQWLTRWITLL